MREDKKKVYQTTFVTFFGITKYLTELCKFVKRAYAYREIKLLIH